MSQGAEEERGQPFPLSLSLPVYKWDWEEEHHLGHSLLACDLQNNNTDLDVKVVIQTLEISGLLIFNTCSLCFIAVSMQCATRVFRAFGLCSGPSFLGIQQSLSSRLKTLRSAHAAWVAASDFPTLGVSHATFPLKSLNIWKKMLGVVQQQPPSLHLLFHAAQPASLPTPHSPLFCPVGHKSLGKLFGEGTHFYPSCSPST